MPSSWSPRGPILTALSSRHGRASPVRRAWPPVSPRTAVRDAAERWLCLRSAALPMEVLCAARKHNSRFDLRLELAGPDTEAVAKGTGGANLDATVESLRGCDRSGRNRPADRSPRAVGRPDRRQRKFPDAWPKSRRGIRTVVVVDLVATAARVFGHRPWLPRDSSPF